jgi:hypothetical protein
VTDERFAELHMEPLTRAEALALLGRTNLGFVVCHPEGRTERRPAFHVLDGEDVVVLTILTPELRRSIEDGEPMTYEAEDLGRGGPGGWYATVTGTAGIVTAEAEASRHRVARPALRPGRGTHLVRMRPELVAGHRFEAPANPGSGG